MKYIKETIRFNKKSYLYVHCSKGMYISQTTHSHGLWFCKWKCLQEGRLTTSIGGFDHLIIIDRAKNKHPQLIEVKYSVQIYSKSILYSLHWSMGWTWPIKQLLEAPYSKCNFTFEPIGTKSCSRKNNITKRFNQDL